MNINVFGVHIDGGMSEYVMVPSDNLLHGEGLDYDELALAEPLAIGAHGIRRAAVKQMSLSLSLAPVPLA